MTIIFDVQTRPFVFFQTVNTPLIRKFTIPLTISAATSQYLRRFLNSPPHIRNFFTPKFVYSTTIHSLPNALLKPFCSTESSFTFTPRLPLPRPFHLKDTPKFSRGKSFLTPK